MHPVSTTLERAEIELEHAQAIYDFVKNRPDLPDCMIHHGTEGTQPVLIPTGLATFMYGTVQYNMPEVGRVFGTDGWERRMRPGSHNWTYSKEIDGVMIEVPDASPEPGLTFSYAVDPVTFANGGRRVHQAERSAE